MPAPFFHASARGHGDYGLLCIAEQMHAIGCMMITLFPRYSRGEVKMMMARVTPTTPLCLSSPGSPRGSGLGDSSVDG